MKTIKNLYFLIFSTLLLMPVSGMADNTLVIEPFDIKGGETKNLIIDLENDQPITLVQFELQLPEGLSVEKKNATKYKIGLEGNRTDLENHSIGVNFLTDPEKGDFYRILLSSTDNIELEGTSGPVLYITIAAASTFKSGTIKLTGIELVSPDETPYHPAEVTLSILPSVTVTIQNAERAYGAANPDFTYTTSEEIDLTGKVTFATEATATSDVGDYAITGTSTATDVNVTFVYGTLTVTPAALTVTANAKGKVFGDDDPALTYETTGLVNGDLLTGSLTRDEGENVGTYAIKQGTLAATLNYTLTFNGANLTIAAKTVTEPVIEFAESTFTYSGAELKPAITVKDGETTIPAEEYTVAYDNNTNVGKATVTITDKANGNYTVSGTTTFTITPKTVTTPTIVLAETSVAYDGTAKEPAVTAVKDGETTIPAEEYTVSYSNNTNAGTATVTIADKDGGNYAVSGTKTFTIAPKTITSPVVTLAKTSFTYSGTAQEPAVTVKDGETAIPTSEYTVTYSGNKNVGTATATVTDKDGGNYTFEGSSASFTITKAMLTVTARNASRKVDQENPTFELTYSGFKNGETENVLTVKPVATTEATADSPVGDYVITVSGGEDENYDFTYVNGTLTIAEKTVITITAKNATRKYGNANPTFEYTVSGGDITGTPELTCQATATSPVGEYTIKVGKGSITTDANFVVDDGALTVAKALLKVTAKDASREEGEENPTFELTYSGFKNGETESVLTVKPVATTTATTDTPEGMYPINVEGGEAQNYEFTYVSGTLTITEREVIDGISTLSLEKVQDTVYTLSGQRVEKPRKGRLYIVNGRKVVLK